MGAVFGKLFSKGLSSAAQTGSKVAKNGKLNQGALGKTSRAERRAQRKAEDKFSASTSGTKSNPLNSDPKTPPPLPSRTQTPPPPPPLPPTNKATTTEPWKNSKGQPLKSQPSNGITPESLQAGRQNLKPIPGAPKSFGQKAKGLATSTFGQVVGGTLVGSAALAAGSSMFGGSKGQEAVDPNAGSAGVAGQGSGYGYGSSSSYGIPGSMYA